jgi:hypothetical protein
VKARFPGAAAEGGDPDALARELVSTGVLNWLGPQTHLLVVSDGDEAMTPEDAKAAVDFAFSTPRPILDLELAGAEGRGRPAAWFAMEYAVRKAEWGARGLRLSVRARRPPSPALLGELPRLRAALVLEAEADGAPRREELFPAARARIVVGAGARDPEGWVDALSDLGVGGVRWMPAAVSGRAAAGKFAAFSARALSRMIERSETSDLRDERAVALLAARPWEVPGVEILETLAYGPDGRVFASEAGRALALAGDEAWVLGATGALRFEELRELPLARAIAAAAWRPGHPVCADCPYRGACALPLSGPGGFGGPVAESVWCRQHLALLDTVFSFPDQEKCMKALEKCGVDISRLAW